MSLVDDLLATVEEGDRRREGLLRLRARVLEEGIALDQARAEAAKLNGVVEKVTAPANRVGTLLSVPSEGFAVVVVGGSEFYSTVDPRLTSDDLKIGARVLVNEAYSVIRAMEPDISGPTGRVQEVLADGRIRVGEEHGLQSAVLARAAALEHVPLKVGDEIRMDPSHRVAVEVLETSKNRDYFLEEAPNVDWTAIGGQKEAIRAIREALEHPLLYPDLYKRYQFSQPKGFLLHGPPGCGKTMIGKATAASLVKQLREKGGENIEEFFLHVKGPEILNMWLGESERLVREIFAKARDKRKSGFLPFIFIDEAESILGTRRSSRSHNITSTLVPMFCAEMDGIESIQEMVIILASNRPDLIDPAVLRPGRIDRKIKVERPDREEAKEILGIYLSNDLPLQGEREALLKGLVENLFNRSESNRVLEIRLRNGKQEILYRSDLISGAILASIVHRAKERTIRRAIAEGGGEGIALPDLIEAAEDEYREGEILPPTDVREEWLKLLDVDPENVVALVSLRGRTGGPRSGRVIV